METPVSIIMGSDSDWQIVKKASDILNGLNINHDVQVLSAHRAPERLNAYIAHKSKELGVKVFIAAAGKAAHLPGVIASLTTRPVIGIPLKSSALEGMDALLSIVQMPAGIPVACVAIDGAENAALLAAQMLALLSNDTAEELARYRENMKAKLNEKNEAFRAEIGKA